MQDGLGFCPAYTRVTDYSQQYGQLQYTPQAVDVDSQVICMLKQDPHSASGGSDMEEGAITCMTSSPISTAPTRALARYLGDIGTRISVW